MSVRLCIAGATGWTGSAVAKAPLDSDEFEVVAGLARRSAGTDLALAVGRSEPTGVRIVADPGAALARRPDVWIDYTHPEAVRSHAMAALAAGSHVVIGTSGLTRDALGDVEAAALRAGRGAIAAGNFSVTAALLKRFAEIAARHAPHREIVDYAHAGKPDAPSGTALELAESLSAIPNRPDVPVERTLGEAAARGAAIGGSQVHSVRLPGYTLSVEAVFGLAGERLTLRHDAGERAEPYVAGTLLAARRVAEVTGLIRGLDRLLFD